VLQLKTERRPWIVHIETWNEWHEGTDIAASREYGRSYIVLTRLFSDMWRTKTQIRLPSSYLDGNSVTWMSGQSKGLILTESSGDGVWKKTKFDDVEAVVSAPNPHSDKNRYLYFNVDDAFAYELFDQTVSVSVTYRDTGCLSFLVEYDSSNPQAGLFEGAFRPVGNVSIEGTGKWKTAKFTLPQCRFMNHCNGNDFRIAVVGGDLELAVSNVILTRTK